MQHQTGAGDTVDDLVPVSQIYRYFADTLRISPRTLQWYATEGLIPKPVRRGRDAFYDLKSSQIYNLVHIIWELQQHFNLRLWKIKDILRNYKGQNLYKLRLFLEQTEESYPLCEPDMYGNPSLNEHNEIVRVKLIEKLRAGIAAEKLSLLEIEREADQYEKTPPAPKKEIAPQEEGEVPF